MMRVCFLRVTYTRRKLIAYYFALFLLRVGANDQCYCKLPFHLPSLNNVNRMELQSKESTLLVYCRLLCFVSTHFSTSSRVILSTRLIQERGTKTEKAIKNPR